MDFWLSESTWHLYSPPNLSVTVSVCVYCVVTGSLSTVTELASMSPLSSKVHCTFVAGFFRVKNVSLNGGLFPLMLEK